MSELLLRNILVYSAQVLLLTGIAGLLEMLWRSRDARLRLWHWQLVLLACVLLPWLQPWQSIRGGGVSVTMGPVIPIAPRNAPTSAPLPWDRIGLGVLLTGCALMSLRLVTGAVRIAQYRRRSTAVPDSLLDGAELRLSPEIRTPITFGFRRPVILIPEHFEALDRHQQGAILEHELTHVRRNDWLFVVAEELIRTALWFHPAIWFVIGRIHVAREQAVDQEVIERLGMRDSYLDALLAMAGLKSQAEYVPAPLFLRQRHLAERVAAIVKEVSTMNPKRLLLSLSASAATLVFTGFGASALLPLQAPAQEPLAGTASSKSSGRLLHKVEPQYPPEARAKRIEGPVALEIQIDSRGLVTDARVVSGAEELRNAALQAILQWQFIPDTPGRATVEMNFRLMDKEPNRTLGTLAKLDLSSIPEDVRKRLEPRLGVKEGDLLDSDKLAAISLAVRQADRSYGINWSQETNTLRIGPMAQPVQIKVGGNLQSAKLTKKVPPQYPPLAKQAGMQGQVRMMATIDKEGRVAKLEVVSGEPLLADAAVEAVKQWEYEKTLLNGNPVAVLTMIDVNFTLAK